MSNKYITIFKKAIYLFFLFISACGSIYSPAPNQTRIPTVLPTRTILIPIATRTSNAPGIDQSVTNHTPLPQPGEYIIYSKYNTIKNQEEIWAINPDKLDPLFLTENIVPRAWSPSNNLWLFTNKGSIYVANADGSDIRVIYNDKKYNGIDPIWLTNDVVLFNAYRDNFSPPDMYSLDIGSDTITQLFPGLNQFIQATFPSEKAWLRGNWLTGSLDLISQNGKTEKFFDNFMILADYFNPHQIQRINRLNKYLIVAKGPGDSNYKFWLVSNHDTSTMVFDPGNEGVNFFRVSPDEQYFALTYVTSKGTFINIINLENQQLVYNWPCPHEIGTCDFVWSPDSQSIVLPYSDSSVGTSNGITSGIQAMNIKTGETKKILKENVTQIIAWHSLK